MRFRKHPEPDYAVVLPRHAARPPQLGKPPTTIAPPISGLLVRTANNRPYDPASWQNEPGPGVGETPAAEVVRRDLATMEAVPQVRVPGHDSMTGARCQGVSQFAVLGREPQT